MIMIDTDKTKFKVKVPLCDDDGDLNLDEIWKVIVRVHPIENNSIFYFCSNDVLNLIFFLE